MNKGTRFGLALAFLVVASVLSIAIVALMSKSDGQVGDNGATSKVVSSGKPRVGGPFELVSHTGKTVTNADFSGKYMLMFFGFTFCPDVCPTELQVITSALEELGPTADKIQPIFVTVDPERDTPEAMAQYVAHFHPSFVGLTGSPEQIAKVAKAFRVYYKRVEDPSSAAEYTMDHSAVVYLMGPEGAFLKHYGGATSPEAMAKSLKELVQ